MHFLLLEDNDGETYVTLQQEEFILVNDEDKSQEDDESQCKLYHIMLLYFMAYLFYYRQR